MPLKPEDLKKPETVLPFLNKLETEIASLKALTAVMSQRPSSVESQAGQDSHPAGFCDQSDACPQCQPYLEQAKVRYVEALNAGRNNILTKLHQASIDLGLVESAEVLGARMAQMEASEGDQAVQLLIVQALGGQSG